MLRLNIFFQTDIFSLIFIGFIWLMLLDSNIFLRKDNLYMLYFLKIEIISNLPTIWLIRVINE